MRVRIGAAGSLLGRRAHSVRDEQVPAGDVTSEWGARLTDALAASPSSRLLLLAAVSRRPVRVDATVRRAADLLAGGARVATVADALGVTERRLHRRCCDAVGYGPKTLARVVRLHRLARTRGTLAERALAAGYASQAHMGDDVKRLTGLTPVRFLEDRG